MLLVTKLELFALFVALIIEESNSSQNVCMKITFKQLVLGAVSEIFSGRYQAKDGKTTSQLHSSLKKWKMAEKQILRTLPIEKETRNFIREVRHAIFSKVNTTPFNSEYEIAAYSSIVLTEILDLNPSVVSDKNFLLVASGSGLIGGLTPLAHRYGGHQFGAWADQLGDGRAHLLGEYLNSRNERWELQLKGSGKTPYSRRGDGRAVIRSSVREFLCSEAMFHLGVPTSRAATLIVSDDVVWRDQFYDGHAVQEKTAVVLRLAKSWFRIGSFEILFMKNEIDLLRKLADFVIENQFSEISPHDSNKYLIFYSKIVEETAEMIAKWQSFGFAHGVCNTDNFSILSITIDYGPFRFMDEYDPKMVPNTSDDEKRYSFKNQPQVGKFNLDKLRISLLPLLDSNQHTTVKQILAGYEHIYKEKFLAIFRQKLGLNGSNDTDKELIDSLLKMMAAKKADFTMTFRQLGDWPLEDIKTSSVSSSLWSLKLLEKHKQFKDWTKRYYERINFSSQTMDDTVRRKNMHKVNPRYVLRNWIAENVIKYVERKDYKLLNKVQNILRNPFEEQEDAELLGYADPPPNWASHIKVSCSS